MKYSEAIRLGSMLGPQGFGVTWERREKSTLCANQAACEALNVMSIYQVVPHARLVNCPVCGIERELATTVATCLNDKHRWTREQIADWLVASGNDCESATAVPAAPVGEPVNA